MVTRKKLNLTAYLKRQKRKKISSVVLLFFSGWILVSLILNVTWKLPLNAAKPVDAFLVLGGSIRREIYVTQLARDYPNIPILISQGSPDPCIWLLFQRERARLQQVWLEKCANSTFGNFFFGLPILKHWRVHKVQIVTSPTHLPRAKWLAQIILGANGIWVEPKIIKEEGIPGNHESTIKTILDVTRSLFWAVASQVFQPPCTDVIELVNLDLQKWRNQDVSCEHQGKIRWKNSK